MIDTDLIEQFETDGLCVVPNVLPATEVAVLWQELEAAMAEDLEVKPNVFDASMVHNCMFRGVRMAALLDSEVMNAYVQAILAPSCILYAYQSSSLPTGGGNYGSRVHVDAPRFVDGYITNVGVIFPLMDFDAASGGTLYVPGSHKVAELPGASDFDKRCQRVTCKAGDMIMFNARLAHAAGINQGDTVRHALTLNFCRCFMRQRFDFARMVSDAQLDAMGAHARRLLGWNVRMPTSLDEFYLPTAERLYKPGQE